MDICIHITQYMYEYMHIIYHFSCANNSYINEHIHKQTHVEAHTRTQKCGRKIKKAKNKTHLAALRLAATVSRSLPRHEVIPMPVPTTRFRPSTIWICAPVTPHSVSVLPRRGARRTQPLAPAGFGHVNPLSHLRPENEYVSTPS